MKRSEVNCAIDGAIKFFKKNYFPLPPFAYWTPKEWSQKGREYDEIRHTRIGWDVTDFGSGNFKDVGRTIFTLRNGKYHSHKYPKSYCQKAMFLEVNQKSPIHFHAHKMEDIFNQGGGQIHIRFWKASQSQKLSGGKITIKVDARLKDIKAGEWMNLTPGQSVSIIPGTYHEFCAKKGFGPVLSIEVSSVCDDVHDNLWFDKKAKRFPEIIEDESPRFVLCSEY